MQLGRAQWRILKHVKHANPHMGPVYMSKIDIADGFCRIWVRAANVPKLGVLSPSRPGDEPLVGFPLALPMGWKEAPKIFTAVTETVADLANQQLSSGTHQGDHRLEAALEQTPPTPALPLYTPKGAKGGSASLPPRHRLNGTHYRRPVGLWDVYVDDFLGLVQGNKHQLRRVKMALLHALDSVLRPLDAGDSPYRQ
jgi:hypothetical protein